MQVYSVYFKIMKKQLLSIILYGIMFLGITIIITFAIFRDSSSEFDTKKVPLHYVNQDKGSVLVEGMLTYLEQYVEFKDLKDDEEIRQDALFNQQVAYILTIPENFTEDILAGRPVTLLKATIPDASMAVTVDTAINNYLNTAKLYIKYQEGATAEELNAYINKNLELETKVTFDVDRKNDTLLGNEFNSYYFNYLGYIMIVCFIGGVSIVMLSFHGMDVRRRHFASPLTGRSYNTQLIMANLVFVMCYLLVFMVAGYLCNPFRSLNVNLLLLWINSIMFGLTVLSISYLVGISVKSKNAVQALSTMLSLGLAFISGMFVPQEFLGASVLRVASFTPSYWFVKTNNMIGLLTNYSIANVSEIFGSMAIQLGFAAAIISIALVVNKRKRQQAY